MCHNHSHLLAVRIRDVRITGPTAITITVELAQDLTVELLTGGRLIVPSSASVSLHFPDEERPCSSAAVTTVERSTSLPAVGARDIGAMLPPLRRASGNLRSG